MISVSSAVSVCSGAGGAGGCTGAVCGLAESAFAPSGTDAPALSLAAGSRAIAAGMAAMFSSSISGASPCNSSSRMAACESGGSSAILDAACAPTTGTSGCSIAGSLF